MKQKIVIKVEMHCDKCRTRALKIAATADGVISVALEGPDKDKVVVIGDGVDAACLTSSLRKKVNYASLVSVEEVKEKGDKDKEKDKDKDKDKDCKPYPPCCTPSTWYQAPHCEVYKVAYDPYPSTCTLM